MHFILSMQFIIFVIFIVSTVQLSIAYDLFEGLGQQGDPCFETIHNEGCNTSLSNVFTPEHKGADINSPDTMVYLFTRKNPEKGEPLHECGGRLPKDSDFDPQADTVILIHGWLDGICRTAWMREMKLQLFKRDNYNVILTDWTWGNSPDYAAAAANSKTLGDQLGFVIKNIMIQANVNGDKFHLIGHSFGTTAASFAAKFIKKWKKNQKVRRLTGLDPAFAPFQNVPPSEQLSYRDAKFVDVIHSGAGNCFPFSLGTDEILGHADFYPNGGSAPEACVPYIFKSLLKWDFLYGLSTLLPPFCSHLQSIQYFKVSINPSKGKYVGVRCNSYEDFKSGSCKRCCNDTSSDCAVAGMDSEFYFPHKGQPRQERKYYFDTSIFCPFDEDYKFSIYKDC